MASKSWVRRMVRRFRVGVLAGWALAGLGALGGCEEEATPEGDTAAICSEIADRLRSCELLSEGEADCRIFEQNGYGSCIVRCVRAASCEQIRAQSCEYDYAGDNPYPTCKGKCESQAFEHFDCGDGQVVNSGDRCDDAADCTNGADERGCDVPPPSFACGNGAQVRADEQCNGASDCSNGRDEEGCPARAETICPDGF